MSEKPHEKPKTCAYCDKILHGRSDQVYCNDHCRNTFNRRKREAEKVEWHENTPEIFRIIKNNYEILKRGLKTPMDENESVIEETAKFMETGFNPKFFTSIKTDQKGEQWCCVFEMCFSMGDKYIFIKDFPEQAEL